MRIGSLLRGMCNKHYQRARKRGFDPIKRISVTDRFWFKVDKYGPVPAHAAHLGHCWIWAGKPRPDGYGEFGIGGRYVLAHIYAWELHNKPVPDGRELDHECRNRICVNPNHLRPVPRKQNMENLRGARRDSKSGVRGVWWVGGRIQKWRAGVRHYGQMYNVGYFSTIDEANIAVRAKRDELFTHHGRE